jgi:hypothetical protein
METADKTIASGDNGGAVSMSPPPTCSDAAEWGRYLDETGHIKRYDGYCECGYCQTVRREFPRWIAEHPNIHGA